MPLKQTSLSIYTYIYIYIHSHCLLVHENLQRFVPKNMRKMWIFRGICVGLMAMMIIFVRGNEDERYRSVGGKKLAWRTVVVDQSGHGNFSTIQAAIDSVPSNNMFWVSIHINPGIYRSFSISLITLNFFSYLFIYFFIYLFVCSCLERRWKSHMISRISSWKDKEEKQQRLSGTTISLLLKVLLSLLQLIMLSLNPSLLW